MATLAYKKSNDKIEEAVRFIIAARNMTYRLECTEQ